MVFFYRLGGRRPSPVNDSDSEWLGPPRTGTDRPKTVFEREVASLTLKVTHSLKSLKARPDNIHEVQERLKHLLDTYEKEQIRYVLAVPSPRAQRAD